MLRRGLLLISVLSGLFVACNKEVSTSPENSPEYSFNTKASIIVDSTFLVTYSDVEQYVLRQEMAYEGKKCVHIEPLSNSPFPIGYVIQYESGWEILSADRRGPILLASSQEGFYCFSEMPDGAQAWLSAIFEDVSIRWSLNNPLNANNEDEVNSVNFWINISHKAENETKADPFL